MKTILEVLDGGTAYLEKRGIENARLNIQHLLAHVLKKKRMELYMEFDRPLSETELAPLRKLMQERGTGRPLQHLLGTVEFFGREFLCDSRALIPRSETEQLIEIILQAESKENSHHILDIGTGSGVIAITLALECPSAKVTAIDLSDDALELAKSNAARLELAEKIIFSQGDLLPSEHSPYHVIVANLPYIPSAEIPLLSREVNHDPMAALDGGKDGLDIIRNLITRAPAALAPGGRIYLEIGHDQGESVRELLEGEKFRDIMLYRDYQEKQRFITATYG
ncbi:MAG: peptide chain release factor N(5)-glutamine methyltransferase [Chthoniobacterales bacterium]